MTKIRNILVLLLLVIAVIVFVGVSRGANMWLWIAGYWAVLSAKNLLDWVERRPK